jgi:hypothetical protein
MSSGSSGPYSPLADGFCKMYANDRRKITNTTATPLSEALVAEHSVFPLVHPILHTAWLDNHALTLKSNTAKYYFGEKSSFLHTFLIFRCESRKI